MILKHLRKHRGEWEVTVRCGRGKHTAMNGLCHKVYHDQEGEPHGPFDSIGDIGWYENYNRYTDRPNSKITNCLAECFGLEYDLSLGRYEIRLSARARAKAATYLESIGAVPKENKFNTVIIHYQGNTSSDKKNLKQWQAKMLCQLIMRAGRIPVILDWDHRSTLPDNKTIFCPHTGPGDIWGEFGSGDAEVIASLIHLSEAFIGIDSGPGKCASSTGTPSLCCWKALHPIQFHDPAPNTMHLIPHNWKQVPPCEHDGVATYFRDHYQFDTYRGEHDLVQRACIWLAGILKCEPEIIYEKNAFVLPNGIGDCMWALHKIRSIANGNPIDIVLAGDPDREIDQRAIPFLKRFPWIHSVEVMDVPHLEGEDEHANDARGRYRYLPDGPRGGFHYLMPNTPLEHGLRLEEWIHNYPCDWKVIDTFDWKDTDRGEYLGRSLAPFVAFYLGPEQGNVDEGHNRGFLWEPRHWVALGKILMDKGLKIAIVGAHYDRSYWERYVRDGVGEEGMKWLDLIGQFEIGETFAFLKQAKFFISYQCGLGIVGHYMGVKVAMWWRKDGDSCHPKRMVSFDERMASAWTNPELQGNYIPLIYRRETVGDIMAEIEQRGWTQ